MNRDPYALHRACTTDPHLTYCRKARATLDALRARRKRSFFRRLVNLFR